MGNMKYFAFISYSHKDSELAKWLQHEFEYYELPAKLFEERKDLRKEDLPESFRPVFRDEDELSGGELKPQISEALADSEYLIVVCSPHSAQSVYVDSEIKEFISLSQENKRRIFPFIVDGKPHQDDDNKEKECFPKTLLELSEDETDPIELIAGDIHATGRDHAFVKILAGTLNEKDIRFADLWNRYAIEKAEKERKEREDKEKLLIAQSRFVAEKANIIIDDGDALLARRLALDILPKDFKNPNRPYTPEAERVLRKALKRQTGVFKGHSDSVNSAVFSSDKSNVVSVSRDSTIIIWDAYSGSVERVLSNHTDVIHSICFNGDKSLFITSSNDNTAIVWDAKNYEMKYIIPHSSCVGFASFSPDGKKIATAAADSIVRIWDLNKLDKPIRELAGHSNAVRVVSFSPDSRYIVTGSDDYTLKIWDLTSDGQDLCVKSLELHEFGVVRCASYNKDGSLIIATDDTNVYLLDVNDDYKLFCPPIERNGGAWWACFSPDEKMIATASYKDICLWEFDKAKRECKLMKSLIGHNSQITHLIFSDDGNGLLSTSSDETIRLWDFSEVKETIEYQSSVISMALSTNADVAVATSYAEQTRSFSVNNGEILNKEEQSWSRLLNDYNDCFVFVNSEGDTVYKSNGLRVLRLRARDFYPIRRPITMQTPQSFFPKEENVHFMSISSNGELAITAFKEGKMFLWETMDGTIIKEFDETQNRNRRSIIGAFNPGNEIVATVAWEKTIQLWDTHTGELARELEMPHNYWGNSIQFSFDGKLIVSASQNHRTHIWDVETGKLIHNEMSNYTFEDRVLYADFSRDMKYIIAITASGTINIFETNSGLLIDTVEIFESNVPFSRKAVFSNDSKKILILADNGLKEMSLLKVISFCPLEELVERTRVKIKNRELTDSEKRSYYID